MNTVQTYLLSETTTSILADRSLTYQKPSMPPSSTINVSFSLAEDLQHGDYDPALPEHLASAPHSHHRAARAGSALHAHRAGGEFAGETSLADVTRR